MKCMVALLLLGAVIAQAQDHAMDTLKAEKADLFQAVTKIAGVDDELSNPKARVTVLAPSDEAVKTFLKDMGLTVDDLKKHPQLARALVAYHTVLGVAAGPNEIFAKGDTVEVPTTAPSYKLTFMKKPDGVFVKDFQGNTAKVSKASAGKGAHTVHIIDKVLYSGSYFKDLAAVLKAFPGMFSDVTAAATKAGLATTLTKQDFGNTVFLPTNAAFKKAKIAVADTPKATLEQVLTYHVVPGARVIPTDFESGKKVATLLKGQDVVVTYKDEGKKNGIPVQTAFVNKDAKVIKANLYTSKGLVHVIDTVLTPKAAEAKPSVATQSGDKKAPSTGRKLLNGGNGRGSAVSEYAPTEALDASEQAIWAAVNGAANPTATRTATQDSLTNAATLTHFREDATYLSGLSDMAVAPVVDPAPVRDGLSP